MRLIKSLIPQSAKNLYHLAMAVIANIFYGFPSRKIKVIGITGTNGKTTTTQMTARILEEDGKKVALASTINFKLGDEEWINKTKYTTLSPFETQKFIWRAVRSGCSHVVLETSSHSLDQYRVWGVRYETAIVTNLTREHLDYHETMEQYRMAKEKLFKIVEKNNGVSIVNLDMDEPENFLKYKAKNIYGITTDVLKTEKWKQNTGLNMKIILAENIQMEIDGSSYDISGTKFKLNIPGIFNIENALVATCVGFAENISTEKIISALEKIKGIPGRLEKVPNSRGIEIVVDFALTPDAMEKLYELTNQTKKPGARVITVFGSCGERDRGKRPIMGKIASESTDFVILTDDEPYHEDPMQIIDEIAGGIENKEAGKDFWKILDRREAIKKALEIAKENDVVLVSGMGSFDTRAIGDEKIPWSDREVIEEELAKLA